MSELILRGCRQHNLRGFDLTLPKRSLVCLVGVSGSGKTSLVCDTVHLEAQRRFLECLSPRLRSSGKLLPRAAVDLIEGLSPCLALGQGRGRLDGPVLVGQHTDLNDLFGLLYSRRGTPHLEDGAPIERPLTRQEMVAAIRTQAPDGTRLLLLSPLPAAPGSLEERLARLCSLGFVRFLLDGVEWVDGDPLPAGSGEATEIVVVIDRITLRPGIEERLTASVETALNVSRGRLWVDSSGVRTRYTEHWLHPATGERWTALTLRHFSTHSPVGACSACAGAGGCLQSHPDTPWLECSLCHGMGLQQFALHVTWRGKAWESLQKTPIEELVAWLEAQENLDPVEADLIPRCLERLRCLQRVGLGYVSLARRARTLSEGEDHRVQLAAHISARLSGVLYVLDGPSAGLHTANLKELVATLQALVDLENGVIVVDHHPMFLEKSSAIIELGPGGGPQGGQLLFQGNLGALRTADTPTGRWLQQGSGREQRAPRKKRAGSIGLQGCSLHNIHELELQLPLERLVVLCGVSGSGKSTLALELLLPRVRQWLKQGVPPEGLILQGRHLPERWMALEVEAAVRSRRSTIATYLEWMGPLRELFAQTKLARARGYTAARFSLHRKGGRCEACEGLGEQRVRMELLPDVWIPCEVCDGACYSAETLQCQWNGRSIAEILQMTIEEAWQLFELLPQFAQPLQRLLQLGLGYLRMGRPLSQLSWGELQRLRLGSELHQKHRKRTLYVLDEPCAGLHPLEVASVIQELHQMVDDGHTAIVIEHDLAMIRAADWIVEMGPGGGPSGGKILFQGAPEQLIHAETPTGEALRRYR